MRDSRLLPIAVVLLAVAGCAEGSAGHPDVIDEVPDVPGEDGVVPGEDGGGDADVEADGDGDVPEAEEGTDGGPCEATGPELCNGLDDDCDRATDEDFDLQDDPANCGECGFACGGAAHAAPACDAGDCGLACDPGYADPDGSPVDGCEYACTRVADVETTSGGTCDNGIDDDCDTRTDATDPDCSTCVPEFCNYEDDDCDGLTDEDYDTDFDALHCGACGTVCPAQDHALPACTLGACDIVCEAGFANTNGVLSDGCEDDCVPVAIPDESICDGVDDDCDGGTDEEYVPYQCGTGLCVRDSVCSHGMPVCEPRRPPASTDATCDHIDDDCDGEEDEEGDCWCSTAAECDDGNPCTSDVCGADLRCFNSPAADDSACAGGICCGARCVDPLTDGAHCGTCAGVCGIGSSCSGGSCGCAAGLLNCDGNWGNGCEVNGVTDVANCGACGSACGLHGACAASACGCVAPYLNCNGGWADGCEAEPATDPLNCGSCGNACGINASCSASACGCTSPFLNCDGMWSSGCEVNPGSDPFNCGRCGNSCGSNSSCSAGSCACSAPWLNCNSSWSDGCEANPTSDSNNCGTCGNRCGPNASCSSSACACYTGWGNCAGGWADGCETSLTTLTNCGVCGRTCDLANASESCGTGTCSIVSCNGGWGNCGGGDSDGCETSLTTLSNCGFCGTPCAPGHASGASCATGSCNYSSCNSGWGDCNGSRPDGCERSLTTLTDCAVCGTPCSLANATESCSSGTCTLVSCDGGYGNCDGSSGNGCERAMNTSTSCGTSCGTIVNCTTLPYVGTTGCSSGSCTIGSCASARAECNDVVSDGCERNLDDNFGTCSGASSIGSVSGDTGSGTITRSSYGEMWYRFRVEEDSTSSVYISFRVQLDVPAGVDYDLYVHGGGSCSSCIRSGTAATGVDEDVLVRWEDTFAIDDGRDVYVEVRFFSGSTTDCGGWTLTVTGNYAVGSATC
ncbi:MAG: hypothetical protein HY907_18900 [Deltaproteobacteria bacterium]|nr:hypothetical protein [Deltaproteobacteria bacterium]